MRSSRLPLLLGIALLVGAAAACAGGGEVDAPAQLNPQPLPPGAEEPGTGGGKQAAGEGDTTGAFGSSGGTSSSSSGGSGAVPGPTTGTSDAGDAGAEGGDH